MRVGGGGRYLRSLSCPRVLGISQATQQTTRRRGRESESNLKWSGLFFFILLGFAAGGAIGFLVDAKIDGVALFIPAIIAAILGVITFRDRNRAIDPTPGGLIG